MVVGEALRSDDVVQVGPHQMRHHVDLLERVQRVPTGMKHVQQPDDVLVVHVLQHAKFAVRSLSVYRRLEWARQLLDGHLGVVLAVGGRTVIDSRVNYGL